MTMMWALKLMCLGKKEPLTFKDKLMKLVRAPPLHNGWYKAGLWVRREKWVRFKWQMRRRRWMTHQTCVVFRGWGAVQQQWKEKASKKETDLWLLFQRADSRACSKRDRKGERKRERTRGDCLLEAGSHMDCHALYWNKNSKLRAKWVSQLSVCNE